MCPGIQRRVEAGMDEMFEAGIAASGLNHARKIVFKNQRVIVTAAVGSAKKHSETGRGDSWVDPTINCHCGPGDREIRWSAGGCELTAIESKSVAYFAGTEAKSIPISSRKIIAILNIVTITVAGPPANHVFRRRCARALTFAAGIINFSHFTVTQRATEHFYFVDQTMERVGCIIIPLADE
jgi:hypothetical protein